jgi:mannose-6-phosphate isomerase
LAIERAHTHTMPKPWGIVDPRPWSNARHDGKPIGEIWYTRPGGKAPDTALLLKLLFTSQPLSIQVHPDDAYARTIGLANGKTEAWYVLSAAPESKVALGLKKRVTAQQLRQASEDGSIADLVVWHAVSQGDSIFVPAGTIHAVGAGLIVAEIHQRSDATFRLFDHGRQRKLHVENAIAVADAGPAKFRVMPARLTALSTTKASLPASFTTSAVVPIARRSRIPARQGIKTRSAARAAAMVASSEMRTLLMSNAHFMFERIDLAPHSDWCLEAQQETWLLVVEGSARTGSFGVARGDVVFARADRVNIDVGKTGMVGLVAYTGDGFVPDLLRRPGQLAQTDAGRLPEVQGPPVFTRAMAPPMAGRMETI